MLISTRFGLLGLSNPFLSQNLCEFYKSHLLGWTLVSAYTIWKAWSNFHLLHNSQWTTFSIDSCLGFYSFFVRLLHSLIWLTVSSLQNLRLLFCLLIIMINKFFKPALVGGFSLESEWQQVSSKSPGLFSVLQCCNLESIDSSPDFQFFQSLSDTLGTVPSASTTTGNTVTVILHIFFNPLARSRYLSFFLLSFSFTLWSAGMAKSTRQQVLFFFL